MGFLDRFSPQQRQAIMIGVPVVGGFALISAMRPQPDADASNSDDAASAGVAGFAMPSTDAIGTGQLAGFESLVTERLNQLSVNVEEQGLFTGTLSGQIASQLGTLTNQVKTLSAPPPAQPETFPTPPPIVAPVAPCPALPAGTFTNPGESVVGVLNAPGGGCWYLSTYGGIANIGGAPFYGSARPFNFGPPTDRRAVSIQPLGKGYRVISNLGEHYDFPG